MLLLRAVYGPLDDKQSNRGMAWYFYLLSIGTDFLSLVVFGQHIVNTKGFLSVFVLVMAIFILVPKPIFAYFLLKSLQNEGFDVKQGFNMRKSTMPSNDSEYQGISERFGDQQYTDSGYTQPQSQPAADIMVASNQQQSVIQPSDDINTSLMDNVSQHDVFAPGQ